MAMLPEDMKHLLNYDEKVTWVLRGVETVVVSDQRLIIRKSTGLGLKKSFVDYPYTNMVNIRLDRGLRKASIEVLMKSGVQSVKIGNLSKSDAFQLHRILRENVIHASSSNQSQPFPVIIQSAETQKHVKEELKCAKCGRNVARDFSLCPFCSYALKIECPECGKKADRKFKVCPYCGEDLSYLQEIDVEAY
jgi:endogenous inhibitor of DNA gyrase (YacG/DUF329 family)